MLFHRLFEHAAREHLPALLVADGKYKSETDAANDIALINEGSFQDLIDQAHRQVKAAGIELPPHAFKSFAGFGKLFDGHLIAEFKAWLKTPNGQFFLQVLKTLALAFITLLLTGT